MPYKKLPELTTLNDRQLAELQIEVLERTRKNTGAIADLIGVIIFISVFTTILAYMKII